jgi:hypothetical protein
MTKRTGTKAAIVVVVVVVVVVVAVSLAVALVSKQSLQNAWSRLKGDPSICK